MNLTFALAGWPIRVCFSRLLADIRLLYVVLALLTALYDYMIMLQIYLFQPMPKLHLLL